MTADHLYLEASSFDRFRCLASERGAPAAIWVLRFCDQDSSALMVDGGIQSEGCCC